MTQINSTYYGLFRAKKNDKNFEQIATGSYGEWKSGTRIGSITRDHLMELLESKKVETDKYAYEIRPI